MKELKIISPSIPILSRAFLECTPDEFMVLAGIQACHWLKDADFEAGAEGLARLLPKMKLSTIQRALVSLKKRDIVKAKRRAMGAPSSFGIYLEDLTFQTMRSILHNRTQCEVEFAPSAKTSRTQCEVLSSTDSKDKTHKEENKQQAAIALPTSQAIASFCEYRKESTAYQGYSATGKDAGRVSAILKRNPDLNLETWRAGFKAFYLDSPVYTQQHSLSSYADNFNKYRAPKPKREMPPI